MKSPSPTQVARAEKQRIARIEGDKALADFAREAVAVRQNMARLRALRLAQEAKEAVAVDRPVPKKTKAVGSARSKVQKLSGELAVQH